MRYGSVLRSHSQRWPAAAPASAQEGEPAHPVADKPASDVNASATLIRKRAAVSLPEKEKEKTSADPPADGDTREHVVCPDISSRPSLGAPPAHCPPQRARESRQAGTGAISYPEHISSRAERPPRAHYFPGISAASVRLPRYSRHVGIHAAQPGARLRRRRKGEPAEQDLVVGFAPPPQRTALVDQRTHHPRRRDHARRVPRRAERRMHLRSRAAGPRRALCPPAAPRLHGHPRSATAGPVRLARAAVQVTMDSTGRGLGGWLYLCIDTWRIYPSGFCSSVFPFTIRSDRRYDRNERSAHCARSVSATGGAVIYCNDGIPSSPAAVRLRQEIECVLGQISPPAPISSDRLSSAKFDIAYDRRRRVPCPLPPLADPKDRTLV